MAPTFDVAVIGAGFGGLAAALRLAEGGASVVVLEALRYPGGCASTFLHQGYRFETGATLFSGLAEDQLFQRWVERYALEVRTHMIDPAMEQRTPHGRLPVVADKAAFIGQLVERMPTSRAGLKAFFAVQSKVADALWALFDDPALLPPFNAAAAWRHLLRSPRYAALVRHVGQPLGKLLARLGLNEPSPFRLWLDATCQITVQCAAAEAEAPFALAALDYTFRGAGHVAGGIGELAHGLCRAIEQAGGEVRLARRVRRLHADGDRYRLEVSKDGAVFARQVVANVLPQALAAMFGEQEMAGSSNVREALSARARKLEEGWGAAMLYRVVRAPGHAPPGPCHLQLIDEGDAPLYEGNHAFVSIAGAEEDRGTPPGQRTLTVSTHVRASAMRSAAAPGAFVDEVHRRLRATLARRAPEWEDVVFEATASPRTWARFTSRPGGLVGGAPRRSGLQNYAGMIPAPVCDRVYLVGDSVFPGQSTLATALGGVKTAERILAG